MTTTTNYAPKDSGAWKMFTVASFGVAAAMMAGGIYFLEASFAAKGFYAMAAIMLVHTSVTITKTLRDARGGQPLHQQAGGRQDRKAADGHPSQRRPVTVAVKSNLNGSNAACNHWLDADCGCMPVRPGRGMKMSDHLMTSRRFAPLFWTQFLSAFNDNFLKNTLVFLILFTLACGRGGVAGHACGRHLHGALPASVGARRRTCRPLRQGADGAAAEARRDRRRRCCRSPASRFRRSRCCWWRCSCSASFRRCSARSNTASCRTISSARNCRKRQCVDRGRRPSPRSWAARSSAASPRPKAPASPIFGPMMMGLAVGCWLVSRYIPPTGSAAPGPCHRQEHIPLHLAAGQRTARQPRIWRAALMVSWFWMVGAIILSILPTAGEGQSLGGAEIAVTAYLAVFAVAIAIGSAIAAWMSQGRMVLLPAPVGTAC